MPLVFLIALPFVGSVLAALLPSNARNAAAVWAALVALAGAVHLGMLFPEVRDGGMVEERLAWLPSLGLELVVRVDGFAWMFGMLVTVIGVLVALYARYYMSPADPVPRFFSFFLAFMGAMLGVVVSGNIIQLVVFWELTSLFSFLLIGYWHHRRDARRGARMALTVTGTGGLCLLAGMLLLGHIVGSYDMSDVLGAGDTVREHPLYLTTLVLVLLGALTKSAQFPFHFWLPRAMAAPTPVSAYLHSATMVKAGVFLLARLWPVMAGTEAWFWIVGGAGACTLLLGAYAAMFQHDLKGLLAYSTISHLGLITLLLGLDTQLAAVAAVFHIMNHAAFKASLFMAAGIIDHETGTRDIRRLSGLYKAMPITGTLAMVATAAMAGVPLLNGFLSKEMFFAETVYVDSLPWVEWALPLVATIYGIFGVVYSLRFGYDVFFGPVATDLPREPHEPPRWMRVPVELLVLSCIVIGVAPSLSIGPALAAAARPVVGGQLPSYTLSVWHGFNTPMIMSLIALVGGALGYLLLRNALRRGKLQQAPLVRYTDGERLFNKTTALVQLMARATLRMLSTRRLQSQMFWLVALGLLAGAAPLWLPGVSWGDRPRVPASPEFVMFWLIGMVCAIAAAAQAKYHRLAALILMSVAGISVSLSFVWFSAPDLALTQLTVEVVTTVLFLLGLRWLPKRIEGSAREATSLRARARRVRDFVLASLAGTGLAVLSYAMLTRPAPQSISPFFLARSLPEGGGTNVVNVMLVDFRSLDTLGEITVLGVVGITVFALLRRFRPPRETVDLPAQQRRLPDDLVTDLVNPRTASDTALGYMLVPAVLARLVLPLAFVIALYLFLRGHNEPGGGFVAGLVVAIGLTLQYMVAGTQWAEAHIAINPRRWVANGLLFGVLTGMGALVAGYPFLTTHTAHVTPPVLGDLHLPSAFFFDLGVFTVVVGATLLIITALAHQSVRARRSKPVEAVDPAEAGA